jgi:ParB family transcriptional regulator, chromosome partitioning protein
MAKRKRLTPAQPEFLNPGQGASPAPAPEVKSGAGLGSGINPPIAQVAGEASAVAALQEVTEAMRAARDEGRLVQRLALTSIVADHLARDRIIANADELGALIDSLREHGQRNPIEVVDLGNGTYGLISGWRRLSALELLAKETADTPDETRFNTVLAFLRRPEAASDAYVAMVEENEIRVGLSYYERARVVALAVGQGVFPTEKAALQRLFATASRAKRSKIGSFLSLYHRLDSVLQFPTRISERLGLQLAKILEEGRGGAPDIIARLEAASPQTPEEEQGVLNAALSAAQPTGSKAKPKIGPVFVPVSGPRSGADPKADRPSKAPPAGGQELRPGVFLKNEGGYVTQRLVLEGPQVDAKFRERLEHWLKTGKPNM